jgi:oligogalacturonide transport system permease protein
MMKNPEHTGFPLNGSRQWRALVQPCGAYLFLCLVGIVMIYPLLWLVFASFKNNPELFSSLDLLPKEYVWSAYLDGWRGAGQYTYTTFFSNSLKMVGWTVLFTLISSVLVAYGFSRFDFPLKKFLFMLMISTLMLPNAVIIIPRYILFKHFGWLDSYLPFIAPAMFGCYPFFIFMLIQFFRGLPKELDESAEIDGCNPFTVLIRILLPLSKPALFAAGIFQFMWTWNDFFNSLIYINSIRKFTVSLALRMAIDTTGGVAWNQIFAMSVVAVLPLVLIFFFTQKYFVEGIATTGLKG